MGGEREDDFVLKALELGTGRLAAGDGGGEWTAPLHFGVANQGDADLFVGYGAVAEAGVEGEEVGEVGCQGVQDVVEVCCLLAGRKPFVLFEDIADGAAGSGGGGGERWVG